MPHVPKSGPRLRLIAAGAVFCLAAILWSSTLTQLFAPSGDVVLQLREGFTDGTAAPPQQVLSNGYFACPDGWCLGAGAAGTLTWRFPATHESPQLTLWFYLPPGGGNRVSVSVDGGQTFRTVAENVHFLDSHLDLGVHVRPGQEVAVRFDASNPSVNQVLALDDCAILYRIGSAPTAPPATAILGMFLSFGAAIVVSCRRWPLALSTLAILALGVYLRYDAVLVVMHKSLDPDAAEYRRHAQTMRLFTETGFFSARFDVREPLFVFVSHVYGSIAGYSALTVRLLTVILSTLSVWAVLRVGRGLFGDVRGQLLGVLLAINGPLVVESTRGLRIELEILALMLYVAVTFLETWRTPLQAAIVSSLAGALLVATRSTYLPVVLAVTAFALYRPGRFKSWVAGVAVCGCMLLASVAPHRYSMYQLHGDAFYDGAKYARWLANVEFAGRPGFPTQAEVQANVFTGPRITYGQWLFGMHTPRELAVDTLAGYWKLFRHMEVSPSALLRQRYVRAAVNVTFQVMAAAGLIIAVWMPRYRWIPLAFVLIELPVAFMYTRKLVESYRHSYSAFPLFLFAAVLCANVAWNAVRRTSADTGADPRGTAADVHSQTSAALQS
jgi:hypothetical protein